MYYWLKLSSEIHNKFDDDDDDDDGDDGDDDGGDDGGDDDDGGPLFIFSTITTCTILSTPPLYIQPHSPQTDGSISVISTVYVQVIDLNIKGLLSHPCLSIGSSSSSRIFAVCILLVHSNLKV